MDYKYAAILYHVVARMRIVNFTTKLTFVHIVCFKPAKFGTATRVGRSVFQ